ncbi:hypothetical protein [Rhizobium ruizarguesonis]|uniref:hypothetical protein n=1 Tax=Rhizobium ruizarguesonis TaxID=2081791 RepID=UPI001031C06A|nr:hypothetical protein [Rhizobium ruizarguesonis]TBB71771.1 hypothetical protein ELH45_14990 [Rhizobium ruizarguesonis]
MAMGNLSAGLIEDEFDYRVWIAVQRAENIRPPYAGDFQVTPLSKFEDPWWEFPFEWLPSGHRLNPRIDFGTYRIVPGEKKFRLSASQHGLLIQQFKETMVAMIYLRTLLPGRIDAAKPLTNLREGMRFSQLFTNLAAAGLKSLSELTQERIIQIFKALPVVPGTHQALIGCYRDIALLSQQGLISDARSPPGVFIEMREVAEEPARSRGANTLTEEETAFLLGHSRTYIGIAPIIAHKVKMYRKGTLSATGLVEWAYSYLPVRKRLRPNSIVFQLDWLVKIAVYNLTVFHLGSRASEALSMTGASIAVKDTTETPLRAQITLTIFKGSKRGVKRTYPVHPYLLKVNAAIRAMADAYDRPIDSLVFLKKNQTLEICTNNLNHKIRRFADMHGQSIDMSSHSWRCTLPDIVVQAADTPFAAIQYQLDHDYLFESIGYGMRGPSGTEIRKSGVEAMGRAINAFVDKCFASPDLGGPQGEMIKSAIKDGAQPDEVKSQMKDFGLLPLAVGKDRFCVKQAHARGACSIATGDDLPEIERCRADCQFQAQLPSNLFEWEAFIEQAGEFYRDKGVSFHEKIRKTEELLQSVRAWPQLRQKLEGMLAANRSLKKWFT